MRIEPQKTVLNHQTWEFNYIPNTKIEPWMNQDLFTIKKLAVNNFLHGDWDEFSPTKRTYGYWGSISGAQLLDRQNGGIFFARFFFEMDGGQPLIDLQYPVWKCLKPQDTAGLLLKMVWWRLHLADPWVLATPPFTRTNCQDILLKNQTPNGQKANFKMFKSSFSVFFGKFRLVNKPK